MGSHLAKLLSKENQDIIVIDSDERKLMNLDNYNLLTHTGSPTSFAMVADNNRHVWLMCGSTGKVWRGYLSNVAWQ